MWLVRAEMGLQRRLEAGDRAAREELVALFDRRRQARRSSIISQKKKLLLLFLFSLLSLSHLRESWRAGIEATREDVREEHCILIERRKREGLEK